MAIGDKLQSSFQRETDPHTGISMTRLTSPEYTSHHMYFYNRMTSTDGTKLLMCQERDGERQLYLLDLVSGEMEQLTEGKGLADYDGYLSPDNKEVFYSQGGNYYRVHVETKERTEVYHSPEGWKVGAAGMSDDFRYMAVVATKVDTLTHLYESRYQPS